MNSAKVTPAGDESPVIKTRRIADRLAVLSIAPEWLDILAALAVQPRTARELRIALNLHLGTLGNRLARMRAAGLIEYDEIDNGTRMPSHLYRLIPEKIQATAADIRAIAAQTMETAELIESFTKKRRQSA